jgi:hypothetical protein
LNPHVPSGTSRSERDASAIPPPARVRTTAWTVVFRCGVQSLEADARSAVILRAGNRVRTGDLNVGNVVLWPAELYPHGPADPEADAISACVCRFRAPTAIRTRDLRLTMALLCRLSYRGGLYVLLMYRCRGRAEPTVIRQRLLFRYLRRPLIVWDLRRHKAGDQGLEPRPAAPKAAALPIRRVPTGAPDPVRTGDIFATREVLCRLSYGGRPLAQVPRYRGLQGALR